ncbi:MAG TPA: hypothetical protein VJC16_03305 [Candidatus Nanoarchaeia archaeon]|nr:hypothetical protein [Candidatus Nanoarchaeia archaeon]
MNKEGSWEECMESGSSITMSPDRAKAQSLLDTAVGRNAFLGEHEVRENNANYLFEGYYSSVLEMLHALLILQGYKVANHICLGYYLRDVLNKNNLFRLFDDCRLKRNALTYYGRKMDFAVAKKAIASTQKLADELNVIIGDKR